MTQIQAQTHLPGTLGHFLRIVLVLFALTPTSCARPAPIPSDESVRPKCPDRASDEFFFPSDNGGQNSTTTAASTYLTLANRPSLSCGQVDGEIYRLLMYGWTRFRVIEVASTGDAIRLDYLEQDAPGLRDPRAPTRTEKRLSSQDWQALTKAIESAGFWKDPGEVTNDDGLMLVEGPRTLIEGRRNGRYRAVTRVGLGPETNNVRALVPVFLMLAGATMP